MVKVNVYHLKIMDKAIVKLIKTMGRAVNAKIKVEDKIKLRVKVKSGSRL